MHHLIEGDFKVYLVKLEGYQNMFVKQIVFKVICVWRN